MSGTIDRELRALVVQGFVEDLGPDSRDVTTEWTIPPDHRSRAVIVAKTPLVVSGMEAVRAVFQLAGDIDMRFRHTDGARVDAETVLVELEGPTGHIFRCERVVLNFLGRLSGIATLTRRFVDAVAGTDARVIDTRKTTPGWRVLEKAAVRHGGGTNHRMGLYDMALVKDNHVDACGGVAAAARAALAGSLARAEETGELRIPVEVEVRDLAEFDEVLGLGVDRILLDNMPPPTMAEAVAKAAAFGEGRPLLEASGNVSLDTIGPIARAGVDLISVGALTHSAPSADVSLRIVGDRPG